mmetsp:Transcript_35939/g.86864  ORF Transcript_35939/g.86864 Transcript_35939/m.86864 type:complete len:662 (+) Transcript_35939:202-2187(+)
MKSFTYEGGMDEATRIPEGTEQLIVASSVKRLPMITCKDCADTLTEIVFPPEGESNLCRIDGYFSFDAQDDDEDDDNTSYNSDTSREMAMGRCTALKTLNIPSSVEIIGDHAFFLCTGLEEVHLSEGLKTIGSNAFGICSSLSKIRIPSTVETMGKLAFGDCIKLKEVVFAAGESELEKIEDLVFTDCSSLADINLPPTIKEIGKGAFNECRKLKSINLPKQLEIIRRNAFQRCISLREVQFHDGLKRIQESAFSCCYSLLRIAIPSTVEYLWPGVFSNCSRLAEVILKPGQLNNIPSSSFANCGFLESISIPPTIRFIANYAFVGCSLTSVELQTDSHINIDDSSFEANDQLCNFSSEHISDPRISESAIREIQNHNEDSENDSHLSAHAQQFWESRYGRCLAHQMCYRASATNVNQLRRAMALLKPPFRADDGSDTKSRKHAIDRFGMTLFHVLLSAAKRRRDLLEVLLREYPSHMLGWKDRWGKQALEYLIVNWTEEAKEMTKMVVQKWMIDRMVTWGLQAWKENISHRLNKLLEAGESSRKYPILRGLCDQFSHFERMEATSILELWLWKMEMIGSTRKECKRILLDRDSSRHRCGASFVIPIVISFLPAADGVIDDDSSQSDDADATDSDDAPGSDDDCLSDAKYKRFTSFKMDWY